MNSGNIIRWIVLCGTDWVDIGHVLKEMQIRPECLVQWIRKKWVKGDHRLLRSKVKLTNKAIRKLKGKVTH